MQKQAKSRNAKNNLKRAYIILAALSKKMLKNKAVQLGCRNRLIRVLQNYL
jgi:hypothetical protein